MEYDKSTARYWNRPTDAAKLDAFIRDQDQLKNDRAFCNLIYQVWFGLSPHLQHVIRHTLAMARYGYCSTYTTQMSTYTVYQQLLQVKQYDPLALQKIYKVVCQTKQRYANLEAKRLCELERVLEKKDEVDPEKWSMACGFLMDLCSNEKQQQSFTHILQYALLHSTDMVKIQLFLDFFWESHRHSNLLFNQIKESL